MEWSSYFADIIFEEIDEDEIDELGLSEVEERYGRNGTLVCYWNVYWNEIYNMVLMCGYVCFFWGGCLQYKVSGWGRCVEKFVLGSISDKARSAGSFVC